MTPALFDTAGQCLVTQTSRKGAGLEIRACGIHQEQSDEFNLARLKQDDDTTKVRERHKKKTKKKHVAPYPVPYGNVLLIKQI